MHWLGVAELASADPVAVVEHQLARIAALNPALKAFTAVDAQGARAGARLTAGMPLPLRGVTIGVKANIDVAGLVTTAGVAGRTMPATEDAAMVAALRAAGAIILGHVNMHEAALGATTDNPFHGRTENPHRRGRTPGGSSGGSGAAVAAGLCTVALGTDTLGSVRIPAAYNGIYGLKPSNGLLDERGLAYLCARLDSIGPLARSVADLAAVAAVMMPLGTPRLVSRIATFADVEASTMEPAVRAGYEAAKRALRGLGHTVEALPLAEIDFKKARLGGFLEAAREGADHFAADRVAGHISPDFAALLDFAAAAPLTLHQAGAAAASHARDAVLAALEKADLLLLPTAPQAAFGHGSAPVNQADFTALANLAGVPALSLPSGVDHDGLPVAVQLIGRHGDEVTLLAMAAKLDAVLQAYRRPEFEMEKN
ncbi:amidohydrolase [Polymorphobacter multimanifer]|nr:amidase [Polymorphobacter multimanifer]GGI83347.1 amidohydrolase [Polymorphobacter multimanifer]